MDKQDDPGDTFQGRATDDGAIHVWPRGAKPPPEARLDICGHCWQEKKMRQKLQIKKTEFPGLKGIVRRDYVCPVHGIVRSVRRQKRQLGRGILKEPE